MLTKVRLRAGGEGVGRVSFLYMFHGDILFGMTLELRPEWQRETRNVMMEVAENILREQVQITTTLPAYIRLYRMNTQS